MYIKRLRLENVKGFVELDFDFERPNGSFAGWTVIVGDNGSGKSTVLKAIALYLVESVFSLRSIGLKYNEWKRLGTKDLKILASLDFDYDEEIKGLVENTASELKKKYSKNDGSNLKYSEYFIEPDFHLTDKIIMGLTSTQKKRVINFCAGYGPYRRVFGESNFAQSKMRMDEIDRFATLFLEDASLSEVDSWLKDLDYKALKHSDPFAKQTRENVFKLLNDDFLPNNFKINDVDENGLSLIGPNGEILSWSEMSDGYKSTIALACDIVRLMLKYNAGKEVLAEVEGKIKCLGEGLVLIDEVDLHLHPDWQKQIGHWFKSRFPKVQFIVTTHSPFICQAADPGGLFYLPSPETDEKPRKLNDEEYLKVIASRADNIYINPIFGLDNTYSNQFMAEREEYGNLEALKLAKIPLNPDEVAEFNRIGKKLEAENKR